jgi:hypothetical protein
MGGCVINKQDLLTAGYREFRDTLDRKEVTGLFEKRVFRLVDDEPKIAYAIHIYLWTFQLARPVINQVEVKVNLFTEVNQSITLTFNAKEETTIEEIEAFYTSAYLKLRCIPDIHNSF